MDDLNGDPVVIDMTIANDTNEHAFTLDSDMYPVTGGTQPLLKDRTVKVSSIVFVIANAGDIMNYVLIDGLPVSLVPYTNGVPNTGSYQAINMLAVFGKPYIPLRNAIKYAKSATATGTARILVHGIATAKRTV
jgi:hypothetical protein